MAYADSATAVTDESIAAVKIGLWYQLGVATTKPTGVAAIAEAGFAVSGDRVTAGTFVDLASASYEVDPARARFRIIAAETNFADGGAVKVDYTPVAAANRRQARVISPKQIVCALRYLEDPSEGKGRNIYIPKCNFGPSGETALKSREGPQLLSFTGSTVDPGGGVAQAYIDGVEA